MPGPISGNNNALRNSGNIDHADAGHLPAGIADAPVDARDGLPRAGLSMPAAAANPAPRVVLGALSSNARANARVDTPAAAARFPARAHAPLPPAPAAIMDIPADVEMEFEGDMIIPPTSQGRIAQSEDDLYDFMTPTADARAYREAQRLAIGDMHAAMRRLQGNWDERQVARAALEGGLVVQEVTRASDTRLTAPESAPNLG